MHLSDEHWMQLAIEEAEQAGACQEVPVGAVLVKNNTLIGRGFNRPISSCDPTAHAEIVALRDAAVSEGNYRLPGATLYVTVEPCTMCFGALVHARISRIVFGAREPRAGVLESQLNLADAAFYNHRLEYTGGVLEEQCARMLTQFFRERRE